MKWDGMEWNGIDTDSVAEWNKYLNYDDLIFEGHDD
jgi:hypothetical protein